MIDDSAGSLLTSFQFDECINASGIVSSNGLINLVGINPALPYHKIFLYQETTRSTNIADYYVKANVTLMRNNQASVILPASVGQDVNNLLLNEALFSLFPCMSIITAQSRFVPCAVSQESITVPLSKSFVGGASTVILGFARVTGSIDAINYNVEGFGTNAGNTITSSRAVMGVLSGVNPF